VSQTSNTIASPASISRNRETRALVCTGSWTVAGLERGEKRLLTRSLFKGQGNTLDVSGIQRLDTAGALVLQRICQRLGQSVTVQGLSGRQDALLKLVAQHSNTDEATLPATEGAVTRLGRQTVHGLSGVMAFLSFIGAFAMDGIPRLLRPTSLRWKQIVGELQRAGTHALPILGMLSFLTGVVIAYQGGTPLVQYGANILIVDLLTITMLREMAPLMTAIIVAGRTGSAYAAQISTMRITEEVDALSTMGMTPLEILALPKLIALIIAMPLLTVYADVMGMAGGIVVAHTMFDVSATEFLNRMPEAVGASSFWVGIIKAPVFAAIIVAVSCYHGFAVQGSTEGVGLATTRSVVQGIFLVIVADAAFSIIFNLVGL